MIKRQFETKLTFDRAPVQLEIAGQEIETVGNSYRAHATMSYLGEGEWKADVTLIESQESGNGWTAHWVKDQLPRDEIAKLEAYLVEQYESETEAA